MPPCRKLVITGGAACGKSRVSDWLDARGKGCLARFDADAAVHSLYRQEPNRRALMERFGAEVLDEDGEVDRKALGRRIFASAEDRRWLEGLIHPQVSAHRREFVAEIEAREEARIRWIVAEIPLWFEAEVSWAVDAVLVVGADPAVQADRLRRLRGLGQEQIDALLASQWTSSRKAARADLVCWNDGTPAALERQLEILGSILFNA